MGTPGQDTAGNSEDSGSVRRSLDDAIDQVNRLSAPQASASRQLGLDRALTANDSRSTLLQLRASRLAGPGAADMANQNAAAFAAAQPSLLQQLSQRQAAAASRNITSGYFDHSSNLQAQVLLLQQEQSLRDTRLLLQRLQEDQQDSMRRGNLGASLTSRGEAKSNQDDVLNVLLQSSSRSPFNTAVRSSIQAGAAAQLDRDVARRAIAGEGKDDNEEEEEGEDIDDDTYYANLDTEDSHTLNNETFPFRVYRMLYEVEKKGKSDIVSFCNNGKVICIHRSKKFLSEIMPEYFSTRRLASFQRQLNLYGFVRINEGRLRGGYHHEFFRKGKRHLCSRIKRQKTRQSRSSIESGGATNTSSMETRRAAGILGSPSQALPYLSHQDQLGGLLGGIGSNSWLGQSGLGLAGLMGSAAAPLPVGPTMRNDLASSLSFQRPSLLAMAQQRQQLSAAISQQHRFSVSQQQQLDNARLLARLNQNVQDNAPQRQNPPDNSTTNDSSSAGANNEGKSEPR